MSIESLWSNVLLDDPVFVLDLQDLQEAPNMGICYAVVILGYQSSKALKNGIIKKLAHRVLIFFLDGASHA